MRLVIEQNRMFRVIRGLQACRHFPRMHGVASCVCVTRDEQESGVVRAVLHMVVGGIGKQGVEIPLIFG